MYTNPYPPNSSLCLNHSINIAIHVLSRSQLEDTTADRGSATVLEGEADFGTTKALHPLSMKPKHVLN